MLKAAASLLNAGAGQEIMPQKIMLGFDFSVSLPSEVRLHLSALMAKGLAVDQKLSPSKSLSMLGSLLTL